MFQEPVSDFNQHWAGQPGFIPSEIKMMDSLFHLIEQHFKVQKSHDFYADQLGLSLKVINKTLAEYNKGTVYGIIQNRLHEEAIYLITQTSMSIKMIAYELRCKPSYFNRCFKLYTGYSPLNFRRAFKTAPEERT